MQEKWTILLLSSGPVLWMIGGAFWKPARRFLWPLEVLVVLLVASKGKRWYVYVGAAIAMVAVNCLPYGDNTQRWATFPVFMAYSLPSLVISRKYAAWPLVVSGIFLVVLMQMSLQHNPITWKIWEASAGLLQAAAIVVAKNTEGK